MLCASGMWRWLEKVSPWRSYCLPSLETPEKTLQSEGFQLFQAGSFRCHIIDTPMDAFVSNYQISELYTISRFRYHSSLSSDISKWAEKTMTQKTGLSVHFEESYEVRIPLTTFFMWRTTRFSTAESRFHEQFLLVLIFARPRWYERTDVDLPLYCPICGQWAEKWYGHTRNASMGPSSLLLSESDCDGICPGQSHQNPHSTRLYDSKVRLIWK
jgi:hypothetical protein